MKRRTLCLATVLMGAFASVFGQTGNEWGWGETSHPHTLIVDMTKEYRVKAFTYLARQDGNQNGMVKDYELYLSEDGTNWGSPVLSGQFKNVTTLQVAELSTIVSARYLKFVAKSEINGNAWASAAEIGIQAESDLTDIDIVKHTPPCEQGVVYDLQGRRHTTLPQGVSIYNGKKILKR